MGKRTSSPITSADVARYRRETFRIPPRRRVRDIASAVKFVEERGFIYFWPIKGVDLPSLWVAVAGDRPVAEEHGDAGHVTWGWKDRLLGEKRWYYAKLLRGKATIVSLPTAPYFYALTENFGDPESDHRLEYEAGRLTQEARAVYEALREHGALDTVSLRREAKLASDEAKTRFDRALTDLQREMRILPIGVAEAGAWRYAFIYEVLDRWFPEIIPAAREIGRGEARAHLAALYLDSVGAASERHVAKLFGWPAADVKKALNALQASDRAIRLDEPEGNWATPKLATQS